MNDPKAAQIKSNRFLINPFHATAMMWKEANDIKWVNPLTTMFTII